MPMASSSWQCQCQIAVVSLILSLSLRIRRDERPTASSMLPFNLMPRPAKRFDSGIRERVLQLPVVVGRWTAGMIPMATAKTCRFSR